MTKSNTKTSPATSLHTEFAKISQGIRLTELLSIGENKCRIILERDSYDKQSHADLHVWNAGTQTWNHVTKIEWSNAAIVKCSSQFTDEATFKRVSAADRNELIKKATIILL